MLLGPLVLSMISLKQCGPLYSSMILHQFNIGLLGFFVVLSYQNIAFCLLNACHLSVIFYHNAHFKSSYDIHSSLIHLFQILFLLLKYFPSTGFVKLRLLL